MRRRGWGSDDGRFPVGVLVAIVVVALAGFGAYWALGHYGFLGDDASEGANTAQDDAPGETDSRPEWLHDTPYELPALTEPENELEPPAHELESWVWGLVTDEEWTLTVLREGEGDNYTWLSDFQALYLVSPTEEMFKISDLRTDFNMDLVHHDLDLEVAWIRRGGKSDIEQVIEYHLRDLDTSERWSESVVSSANGVPGGVANVEYVGDQPDGRELWVSYDPSGYATGVFRRNGDAWESSLVSDLIRRLMAQGFSSDRGVAAWIDTDSARAVYHGVYIDPDTQRLADEKWVVHDLATDDLDDAAVVAVPRDDCQPVNGPRSGVFEGDRIVAVCGGDEYLLDPYGLEAPIER